jgi:DNA-binding CsgD family transcriptional regulator
MTSGSSILAENEKKRLNIRLPLLVCFAMFNAWKMGMVYFAGKTMSVDGKIPLPVNLDNLAILFVAGFIFSIIMIFFFLRHTILVERISCVIALSSILFLFLPLSPKVLTLALYVNFFCCYFMFGFEITIIVALFTKKTAILHLTAAYGISALFIASLHNEFISIPFVYFRLFVIIACAMQLIFYFKIPANNFPQPLTKSDNLVMPKRFFALLLVWVAMSSCVILFGIAVAETMLHGVFTLYLSAFLSGFTIFLLWRFLSISPLSACTVFTAMGALGFMVAICSLYLPVPPLLPCVFFGMAWICCWLGPLVSGVLYAKQYPSRVVLIAIIGAIYAMILIHTLLLNALRDNTTILYLVFFVLAVFMVGLFLVLKPFLDYAFHGKMFISQERSEELIEEAKAAAEKGEPPAAVTGEAAAAIIIEEEDCHPDDELTERERQIAQELMLGLDYKEIAAKLYISPHTVNAHKKSIYKKKGVHNVQGLIMKISKLNTVSSEQ